MNFCKYGPVRAVFALLCVLALLPQAVCASFASAKENLAMQNEHMAYLENEYYTENYTPCDESNIASFDIAKAVNDGVKFNEVAFLGTHNSYQLKSNETYTKLYDKLGVLTFGIVDTTKTSFNMDTLTEQLELGMRSLELDIETVVKNGETSFIVCHDPVLDNTSSCYDFEKALEDIKMWSDNNPNHLPVTIIIEPKGNIVPINGLRNFSLQYANEFDKVLAEKLGDALLTPADMMGDYESFKAMREADGWLSLGDTLGKVLVLLHDSSVTDEYINQDTTIKSQAMFPMLRYADINKSYTSFIIDNAPEEALEHEEKSIDECNLIVRTRADSFPTFSDERYENTNKCKSQIISTDYPFKADGTDSHIYSFDGCTVKLIK